MENSGLSWSDYAETLLPPRCGSYLDYGCGQGDMLRRVSPRAVRVCGVDVDPEVLPSIPGVETRVIRESEPLPFPSESFDVITCLEVIEHVADEKQTFRELARVLRPGGTLILTTPHKGWLTWMDPGNVKFALPRLHRFAHRCLGNRKYEAQFGAARREKLGLISDISANQENPWHRHYRYEEIRSLADDSLQPEHIITVHPGMRAVWCVAIIWRILFHQHPKWTSAIASRLSRWKTIGGDQLVISFRKSKSASS
jgi:ubiquinone/menaquinone biosynthesis C-methylase UbiE